MAQVASVKQQPVSADYPDENIAKLLRRFTSQHTTLLGWAGFQALQLKRVPSNVRQSALLIELTPRPSSDPHRQCVPPSLSVFISHPYPPLQIRRQKHTHRSPHIRHLSRPIGSSRHPTPRRALPTRRRNWHGGSSDPMRSRKPSDARRSRPPREDLVGRAERLGRCPRPLCRFRPE